MLLVRFHAETALQTQDFILRSVSQSHKRLRGGIVKLTLRNDLDFSSTLDNLRKLDAAVEWVEPNYIVQRAGDARSPGFSRKRPNPSRRLKAELPTTELPTTIVALIDTGIDPNHHALKYALSPNDGWNFITNDNNSADDNGHGTQIAGIIVQSAISNLQSSIKLLPLKALDHTGTGTVANVVEAMDYAVAHHAAVINCSFGAPAYSRTMIEAIQRAETAGIVVVAAAGNNGSNLSQSSFYPASYRLPNLLSVAASDDHNSLAQFSNFAADIAAPGVGIRTAHRGNRQVSLTGTSASAGFVAGAAALLKSKRGWVSAQTIRETLLKSADRSFDLSGKVSSGVVNPTAAVSLFTRDNAAPVKAPAPARRMTPAIKAAMQAGANLDTLRSSQPQAPAAYQQTGTLPPASYDDPKPVNVANYDVYLTDMSRGQNAVGVAGAKPMQQVDPTAGSASVGGWSYNLESKSYNFTAPVLSLPGRAGLGVSLALSYNNKMWTSTTGGQVFNLDRGFPAPGWHIGFGHIQVRTGDSGIYYNSVTQKSSIIFVAPDGTRHDLAHNSATGRFESYDSSYISFDAAQQILYFPNGLKMKYGAYSYDPNTYDHQALPIEIKDPNGNFVTINYKTLTFSSSPQRTKVVPDYLIDTAGRRIDFNYQNNRLTSISQNRGGAVFTYAYIDYQPVTIQTNYTNTDPANLNGAQVYFPSRITYPTGVNFRFSYTGYGQVISIEKWVPAITGQGAERKIASTTFYYYDPSLGTQYFSQRNEWTENGPGGSYQYDYDTLYGHELTDPTLRRFRVLKNGMTFTTRIFAPGADNHTRMDEAAYISDSGVSYLSNPRVSQTSINGGGRKVNYSYIQQNGMWLVQNKDEMQEEAIYRRTTTVYTSYPSQYILGLPQQVSVYNGSNTLLSRVANNYDETGSYTDSNGQNAPYWIDESGSNVIQHNGSYGAGFTQRGNLTSVVQSSVVNGSVTATRTIKRVSYDTNGNVRAEADGAANRRQILYTDNYSNKPGGVGQTHVQVYTAADPTGFRAGSQWNYYTGQTIKTFNLTPGSSTEQQVVTTSYDFADRPLQTTRPDGGWVRTAYWDNWLAIVSSQFIETGKTRYKFDQLNGAGVAFKKASDHPDGVAGKYSGHITVFNSLGEVKDSSNVIAIDGGWTPAAEDASTGFLFTNLTHDELSRLKIVTLPDNNTRQHDYTGCGCAGNSQTRATDEM
ncbi:MAG: S8 family serine peptidase, partial [Blastocatellia bacterium]